MNAPLQASDLDRLNRIGQTIFDKKGSNIIAIDLRKISSITEFVVIAEGNVERHVASIAKEIVEQESQFGFAPLKTEGISSGDWVVLDFGHIIVHVFHPELRDRYQLEELFREGEIVDLNIIVGKEKT